MRTYFLQTFVAVNGDVVVGCMTINADVSDAEYVTIRIVTTSNDNTTECVLIFRNKHETRDWPRIVPCHCVVVIIFFLKGRAHFSKRDVLRWMPSTPRASFFLNDRNSSQL